MCPFSGDEALHQTHAACTHGVETKDRDFWTSEISMVPTKKALFLFILVKMFPTIPRSII
jgi:hypothetical protein